jgi:hypothetical protein
MAKGELYVVGTRDGNGNLNNRQLEQVYLGAFPEGTDPIYLKNTQHDCNCCKNFIRNIGHVVAIKDGKIQTVWDLEGLEYPYDVVAKAMHQYVIHEPIAQVFRADQPMYGAQFTNQTTPDGERIRWNHFHGKVQARHFSPKPGPLIGETNGNYQVMNRGLSEIIMEHLRTVKKLIEDENLYRGEEHLHAVNGFIELKKQYEAYQGPKELFSWENIDAKYGYFRNSSIGKLLVYLCEGNTLEEAVGKFEAMVAGPNYKRPKALVTQAMIDEAMKTIDELNLAPALERRHATIADVNVNDVLWVNNSSAALMVGGTTKALGAMLSAEVNNKVDPSKAREISISDFMANIAPGASAIELMMANRLIPNLVSITAPVHSEVNKLFKWGNDFCWSYNGNITDAIREKVKAAGGNVNNALMRVSLAWYNFDDLDLHVYEPDGHHIYYGNKGSTSRNGGMLDVDMNLGKGTTRTPVENVSWTKMSDGKYKVQVNNWAQRETDGIGFTLQVAQGGTTQEYRYDRVVGNVNCLEITVKGGLIVEVKPIDKNIKGGAGFTQEAWGLKTEEFVPVKTIMLSPNYWGEEDGVGNKHHFFILEGCLNDEPVRGIYNEFLDSRLDKHRKVFELLGSKTKCDPAPEQLSGLGFSSTGKGNVIARVTKDGKSGQLFNIKF